MKDIVVYPYSFFDKKKAWIAVSTCGINPLPYQPHCRAVSIAVKGYPTVRRVGTVGRSPFEAMQRFKKLRRAP